MNVKASSQPANRSYKSGYQAGLEAGKKQQSPQSLTTMDKVAIGGSAVLGGTIGLMPGLGSISNSGAAVTNLYNENTTGYGIGLLGALANTGAFVFAEIPDPNIAGPMIAACLLTSAVAGGLSSAMAAHTMLTGDVH